MFSRVLIMKQQCKQLWIVSELDVMRGFCFVLVLWVLVFWGGFLFFFSFFLKGEETEDLL